MTSLANRFRPNRFEDVIGQEENVKVLKTILTQRWRPASLMLTGPFGTGKTSLSRLISRALLCEQDSSVDGWEGEPCNDCGSCRSMNGDANPCYTEVDAASHGLVDDVRRMKELISYRPTGAPPPSC